VEKESGRICHTTLRRNRDMIDETLEQIRKNPHSLDNISTIGVVIEGLGQLMQEYDYPGAIKLGIGHEGESEILDKIASIVHMIRDGTKLYYHAESSSE
jgi:hypothetical protein